MEYWHISISSARRMTIFPDDRSLRKAVRRIARVCREHLVLFCIVDDHVHVVVLCRPGEAGRIARALLLALQRISPTRLLPAHRVHVDSRKYLEWLVQYLLSQPSKHGLVGIHPALHVGSCFQDLIGARVIGFSADRIFRALPRLGPEALCAMVGAPHAVLAPATHEEVRFAGVGRIANAASRAVLVDWQDDTGSMRAIAARVAAANLVDAAELSRAELARVTCVSPRTIRRQASQEPDPAILRAIRLQLSLDRLVPAMPSTGTG